MTEVSGKHARWWLWALLVLGTVGGGGCAGVPKVQLTLPNRHVIVREQLVIHADFPVAARHRLFEELTARRADLSRRLGLPVSDESIHVYLFNDSERFDGFMRLYHPEFPRRRAYFVETDTRLAVYAQWGDFVGEDLRHEVTHGYLHSVLPNVPLWLDEGLAEYFELPRGSNGLHRPHRDMLLRRIQAGWRPDPRRLQRLDSTAEMRLEDYADSWGWVHFLLNTRPEYKDLFSGYLADLRHEGSTEPLLPRLQRVLDDPGREMTQHILDLGRRTKKTVVSPGI
ncbi:MAG: DUF1570 domain-containing protein [Thermoguttaceae bacterium]